MPNSLPLYQVDAFTDRVFGGNPAAVMPLETWLNDDLMQTIAAENNLSETAFFAPAASGEAGVYDLRWFTPAIEVDLCGHATLASAHVVMTHLMPERDSVGFDTRSGRLTVQRLGSGAAARYEMDFPAAPSEPEPLPPILSDALGVEPLEFRRAPWGSATNGLAVLADHDSVAGLEPDFALIARLDTRGLAVTAPGEGCDCASRFFGPKAGINEDPVTGSAHCMIVPYWAERLGKSEIVAHQVSKRGGVLHCVVDGDRVRMSGQAADYMVGRITLP